MKKLLLLLLFIPLMSFGQDVNLNVNKKNEKTSIKTPLTADLSNYTHLLLIKSIIINNDGIQSDEPNIIENLLSLSVFEIMSPLRVSYRKWKKSSTFLKTMKNESYLYIYIHQAINPGLDVNTTFIIRDWKNKTIYNATYLNTGLNEILAPLIDFNPL